MKTVKRFFQYLLVGSLCIMTAITGSPKTAQAASSFPMEKVNETPDLNRKGSISITMRENGKPVGGGSLNLCKVADLKEVNGSYDYVYNETFASFGVSLEDSTTEEIAAKLTEYVKAQNIKMTTIEVGDNGHVIYKDLTMGLYLVTQHAPASPAEHYLEIKPFLITLPFAEKGKIIYDMDASPKVEPVDPRNPDQTPTPTPGPSVTPTTPPGPLPQTGQLWWPVPFLAITGILLLMIGWINKTRTRK